MTDPDDLHPRALDDGPVEPGPPRPFTRDEVRRSARGDLQVVEVVGEPAGGPVPRWRAGSTRAAVDAVES